MKKPFTTIAIGVFSLVAILHALRLMYGWTVSVNGLDIPMWASVLGLGVAVLLAVMIARESRDSTS